MNEDDDLQFVPMPKLNRLRDEYMYITEKIDGTNAHVVIYEEFVQGDGTPIDIDTDGINLETYTSAVPKRRVQAASRNRYISPEDDNHGFAKWVQENEETLSKLPLGRHYGEWWGKGIQRGYDAPEKKLSLFNQSLREIIQIVPCIDFVPILYEGPFDLHKIDGVMEALKEGGSKASAGFMDPEGVVVWLKRSRQFFKIAFDDRHKGEM